MSYQSQQPMISKQESAYHPESQPYILREDEKIPLFLIKLWNIVEDPSYYDVIRWDDSGYSFHITDPYSFCRNVLPQFFKHNNLNSLIRQLNMYGFRKMTPIDRTSLARAESDQDHLEFSHPYFVREHPELLMNIKRKVASKQSHDASTVSVPAKDLSLVFEELRQLRDRQKNMEYKMNELIKENEVVWQEIDHVRGTHLKQQQIVNKLVQFLVSLVQPSKQQRLGKRQLLAIDEFQAKRLDDHSGANSSQNDSLYQNYSSSSVQSATGSMNANDVLDSLINELASGGVINLPSRMASQSTSNLSSNNGPIIADVTDELDQLQGVSGNNDDRNFSYAKDYKHFATSPQQQQSQTFVSTRGNARRCSQSSINDSRRRRNGGETFVQTSVNDTVLLPSGAPLSGNRVAAPRFKTSSDYNIRYSQPSQLQYSSNRQPSNHSIQDQTTSIFGTPQQQIIPITSQQYQKNAGKLVQSSRLALKSQQQRAMAVADNYPVQSESQLPYETIVCTDQQPESPIIRSSLSTDSFSQPTTQSIPICQEPTTKNFSADPDCTIKDDLLTKGKNPSLPSNTIVSTDSQNSNRPTITFQDSPSDFTNYLSSVNQSIDQCRNNIADHWDSVDLDNLLDSDEWQDLLNDELTNTSSNENELLGLDRLIPFLDVPLETPKKPGQ